MRPLGRASTKACRLVLGRCALKGLNGNSVSNGSFKSTVTSPWREHMTDALKPGFRESLQAAAGNGQLSVVSHKPRLWVGETSHPGATDSDFFGGC
jgi:hypothetical protein